ncbi:hypothetical protein SNEBB_010550 [Seison nebaliae]|nr:hypothetical protein SNEBB_010550 [Seison nebaliae]
MKFFIFILFFLIQRISCYTIRDVITSNETDLNDNTRFNISNLEECSMEKNGNLSNVIICFRITELLDMDQLNNITDQISTEVLRRVLYIILREIARKVMNFNNKYNKIIEHFHLFYTSTVPSNYTYTSDKYNLGQLIQHVLQTTTLRLEVSSDGRYETLSKFGKRDQLEGKSSDNTIPLLRSTLTLNGNRVRRLIKSAAKPKIGRIPIYIYIIAGIIFLIIFSLMIYTIYYCATSNNVKKMKVEETRTTTRRTRKKNNSMNKGRSNNAKMSYIYHPIHSNDGLESTPLMIEMKETETHGTFSPIPVGNDFTNGKWGVTAPPTMYPGEEKFLFKNSRNVQISPVDIALKLDKQEKTNEDNSVHESGE